MASASGPESAPEKKPFWTHLPGGAETAKVAGIALALGVLTAFVFTLWPELDIAVSRAFHVEGDGFPMTQEWFWRFLRELFLKGFTVWYVLIVVACLVTFRQRPTLLGFEFRRWSYLALCSLAGPLLLVNIVLKEHWGRWRPREIIPLGGGELHTTPLDWGGTCADNCSFVSGEVASMVMAFIALAFVTTAWRPIFYALAIGMGLLAALIRVGQGGHFLSDALFAGVFMTLIAAGLYWAMFLRLQPSNPATDASPRRTNKNATPKNPVDRIERLMETASRRGLELLDRFFPKAK